MGTDGKPDFLDTIENITGAAVMRYSPLSGGCVGEVYRIDLSTGERLVAKIGDESNGPESGLALEGWMLETLRERSRLPVPTILHATDTLLLMEYIEGSDEINGAAQEHAAELLADLHGVTAPQFGLEKDTLIGGIKQPNPLSACARADASQTGAGAVECRQQPQNCARQRCWLRGEHDGVWGRSSFG